MAYTEIQRRGKKKYYYLAHTMRLDSGFKKVRVFLGIDLSKEKLEKEIKKKIKLLEQKIAVIEQVEKEVFTLDVDFSRKLLSKSQLDKIEALKRKYKKQLKLTDQDVLRKVRESFLITYTYNTNRAEGNTISLKETELILTKGVVPKSHSLREIHEIENTVTAYEYVEQYTGELDHKFILELHRLVTQNTLANPKNAGRYRKKGQNVAMTGSKHFPPKGGRQIKQLMSELISHDENSKLSATEKATIFHYAFILIHPFIDGNGRVSRLLFNWMLLRDSLAPIDFPSEHHIEYTDLMEAARDGDPSPLAHYLFEKIMNTSLQVSTKEK